jgi:hypothetical protein
MIVRELFARLGYKLDAGNLEKFNSSLNQTKGNLLGLKSLIGGAVLGLGSLVTGKVANELLSANREYQSLIARLKTLEGSAEKGAAKFQELQNIATTTPFQLTEVTEAYIRLKAAGFDASESNIRALGDLSVASGKNLGDVTEALLSANRGLGSMVDNFVGLQARAEDGGLTLKNTRTGIQSVVKAGDTKGLLNFFVAAGKAPGIIGGMAEQMKTLNGRISNIQDNIFKFFVSIGESGFTGAFSEFLNEINLGIEGTESLSKGIGQFLGRAIRKATSALKYFKAEWRNIVFYIGTFITLISAAKLSLSIITIVNSLRLLITSLGGVKLALQGLWVGLVPLAKIIIPVVLLTGAFIALGLVIEDLYYYFTGGNSAIGDFISKFEKGNTSIAAFARYVKNGLEGLKLFLIEISVLGSKLQSDLAPALSDLGDAFILLFSELNSVFIEFVETVFGPLEGSGESGLKDFFLALGKIAKEVFPIISLLIIGQVKNWILQIQFFAFVVKSVFGPIAQLIANTWKSGVFAFDVFVQQFNRNVSILKILWLSFQHLLVSGADNLVATLFPLLTMLEKIGVNFDKLRSLASGVGLGGIVDRLQAIQAPASSAPQAAPARGPSNVTTTASVGSVNVNVTQTSASPGQITSAVQGGIGSGLEQVLLDAQANLGGGLG